jgi:CubicO group peptidase (beta-lactamase class C family)
VFVAHATKEETTMSTNPCRLLVTLVLLGAMLAGCGGPAAEPAATPLPPVPTPIPPTPEPAPVAQPEAEAPAPVVAAPEPVALQPHEPRPDAPPYGQRGPYAVGVRDFVIDTPERQIPVIVWYPASNPEGKPELMEYPLGFPVNGNPSITFAGTALAGAEPDLSGAPYPLLVHSHAAWAFPQDSLFLMEHLASHGFVAMAGVHEDNWATMPENTYRSEISRPKDISHEIDFAEELTAANGDLAGVIDTEHVAVSGGSFGGQVGLEMIGARFNLVEQQRSYCPEWPDDMSCEWYKTRMEEMVELAGLDALPEGEWPDWSDPRVDAAVLLSPGVGLLGVPPVKVQRPVLLIEGNLDQQGYGLDGISTEHKTSVTLDNAGHFIFANRCTAQPGMAESGFFFVCSDQVWDMDRAHDLIDHFAAAFLLAELKGDAEAAAALAPENVAFPGIRYETTAYTDAAAAVLDGETVAKIEAMVEEMMAGEGAPGFALGVVKDGELVYAKGFGVTSLDGGQPVTADTAFLWAENTFPLTTVAIMQLVDLGLIDLDAPITDYLPYFKLADERYVDMTVRHILQHRSGLPESGDYMADWTGFQPESDDGALERYVRAMADKTLLFAPGQRQEWSDISFAVLGDVIAKVSGQSFEAYMQEHVLAPLGMDHSSFLPDDLDAKLVAQPHVMQAGEMVAAPNFPYHRPFGAANNLMASAADMARFAQAMVQRGDTSGSSIVSANAFDEMWNESERTAFSSFAFGTTHPTRVMAKWGAGWFVSEDAGTPTYASFGQEYGFQGQMVVAPEAGLAVVAVGNKAVGPAFYASNVAVDVLGMLLEAQGDGN